MKFKDNKVVGIFIITILYVLAALLGIWVFRLLPDYTVFIRLLIGDIAATVLVYLFGLLLQNASVYDPYWSVAPPVILIGMMIYYGNAGTGAILMLAVIGFWAVRLTLNWAYCFHNLRRQDWRYDMLRDKTGIFYPLVSLLGIHLVPTLVVYLAMLPAVAFIASGEPLHPGSFLGWIICITATCLQLVSDLQMARFRKSAAKDQLIRTGLWKHSRHPNYLGEILMWWGVYIAMVFALPGQWYLGVGALANTLLFLIVSIPMADARYKKTKPGYDAYKKETRMLFPVPKRSK